MDGVSQDKVFRNSWVIQLPLSSTFQPEEEELTQDSKNSENITENVGPQCVRTFNTSTANRRIHAGLNTGVTLQNTLKKSMIVRRNAS